MAMLVSGRVDVWKNVLFFNILPIKMVISWASIVQGPRYLLNKT